MSKWVWEKIIDYRENEIDYRLKFETLNLFSRWQEGVESQKSLVQHVMWTNKAKTKAFVWYFDTENRKQEFLDMFRQSIDRINNRKIVKVPLE
jgi:hypothetical protein